MAVKALEVTFAGSGDAFGSGGRLQSCFLARWYGTTHLYECGASSMAALRRVEVEPNDIDAIAVSHLHGDHAGGIPYFIVDAQLVSKRSRPLTIAGPPGIREWYPRALDMAFNGFYAVPLRFELSIIELRPHAKTSLNGIDIEAYAVVHNGISCGAPPIGYRATDGGLTFAYTGDTEWTDALLELARDADLLVGEAYFAEKPVKFHLTLAALREHLVEMRPKRVILTHMSDDVLRSDVEFEKAYDGMIVRLEC